VGGECRWEGGFWLYDKVNMKISYGSLSTPKSPQHGLSMISR